MAANTGITETSMNYYKIADGMLYQNRDDVIKGFEKISEKDVQNARDKFENIDLRGKYLVRDSPKYPNKHYFQDITGNIEGLEKFTSDGYGDFLNLKIRDMDGELSQISTKFYGKYCSDLLNRLSSTDFSETIKFSPYSIPSDFEQDGKTVKYHAQGVSISVNREKKKWGFLTDDGLPPTERVKNPSDGTLITSRVNRVDFLWEKLQDKINSITVSDPISDSSFPKESVETADAGHIPEEDEIDDLPF